MFRANQEELKTRAKRWLKTNRLDYAWLAGKCFVSEATVRNWMSQKSIPKAKEYIINELINRQAGEISDEVMPQLAPDVQKALEKKAFSQGKTLKEYLTDEARVINNRLFF